MVGTALLCPPLFCADPRKHGPIVGNRPLGQNANASLSLSGSMPCHSPWRDFNTSRCKKQNCHLARALVVRQKTLLFSHDLPFAVLLKSLFLCVFCFFFCLLFCNIQGFNDFVWTFSLSVYRLRQILYLNKLTVPLASSGSDIPVLFCLIRHCLLVHDVKCLKLTLC